MEKKHTKESIKDKLNKIIYNKILYYQKNQNINSNKVVSPKKYYFPKDTKKENSSKNINNKTLTDWNKNKIYKRIIQNAPPIPKLYQKKRVDSKNKSNLVGDMKKNELSIVNKRVEKYIKKVVFDSKNLSKKKNIPKNNSQNYKFEFEIEKDLEMEDDSIQINAPHMTGKKKYNYFFENSQTEAKSKEYRILSNKFFEDKNKVKKGQHLFQRAKKYLLVNENNNYLGNKNELCENRYEFTSSNKKSERSKTEKIRDENKENLDSNRYNYNNYNNKNIAASTNNDYINIRKVEETIPQPENKKDFDLSQLSNLFNSLKINKEAKINKIINLRTNNSNINNKFKIKKSNLNLKKVNISAQKRNFHKKINLSYINNSNRDLIKTNINNNNYYINNKVSIKYSSSYLNSGEETKDSPENITDREDDKLNLPLPKINHFFINLKDIK